MGRTTNKSPIEAMFKEIFFNKKPKRGPKPRIKRPSGPVKKLRARRKRKIY